MVTGFRCFHFACCRNAAATMVTLGFGIRHGAYVDYTVFLTMFPTRAISSPWPTHKIADQFAAARRPS